MVRTGDWQTTLDLRDLPLELYPSLTRFHRLYEVSLDYGSATDDKLRALSQLDLPALNSVVVTDGPRVTDAGAAWLGKIPRLKDLGLRETSITDAALENLARLPNLEGIALWGSKKISKRGILTLMRSESLHDLAFDVDKMSLAEILEIIRAAKHVKRMDLGQPSLSQLDLPELRRAAKAKGVMLLKVQGDFVSAL